MLIVLCADENYIMPCATCIVSIFENNRDLDLHVAVLTEGLTDKSMSGLKELSDKYNKPIEVKVISRSAFESLKVSDRFPVSIYFRFLIPSLFPEFDRALYLDCDIIVNGSLKYLADLDLDGYACACVEDQKADDIRILNHFGKNTLYFNSGVLLMNLAYWRQHDISRKCISFIRENPDKCLYADQDALNHVLSNNVKYLSYSYNFQELMYLEKAEIFLSRQKWAEIDKCKSNPIVIHYTWMVKPWFKECKHPLKELFGYYKSMTLWRFVKDKEYTPIGKLGRAVRILSNLYKRISSLR